MKGDFTYHMRGLMIQLQELDCASSKPSGNITGRKTLAKHPGESRRLMIKIIYMYLSASCSSSEATSQASHS